MCPTTLALLDETLDGLPDGEGTMRLPIFSGQNVSEVYVTPSLGCQPPTPLNFRPAPRPVPLLLPHLHPVFDTPADREMTRAIKHDIKRPIKAQSLKIQGGIKNGFKIHLNGHSGQDSNASIQGPKGHNYVITPTGAAKGENISINPSGLYIRAANNKKQLITATSCPNNQVQVQVGQGKSAVQLSIQVAPQGKRGEVELNCVRNEAEDGGTGYTVSVNREADDDGRAIPNKQTSIAPIDKTTSPRCKSPQALVAQCPAPKSHGYETCISDAPTLQAQPYQDDTCQKDQDLDQECFVEKRCFIKEGDHRVAERKGPTLQEQYAAKLREILVQKELIQTAEKERQQNTKDLRLASSKYNANWFYKRKLDLHHHKPTISYLIGRRMTELFKEMRRTTDLHPPAPPFVKF